MRKLLNKPWFVGTLAVVALLFAVKPLFFHGREKVLTPVIPPASAAPFFPGSPAAVQKAPQSVAEALRMLSLPAVVHDPFAVPLRPREVGAKDNSGSAIAETACLSAIWTQNGETLVLINGSILRAGDEIGSFKVESATQEGVWLRHGKSRDFISLGDTFTLTAPAKSEAPALTLPQL